MLTVTNNLTVSLWAREVWKTQMEMCVRLVSILLHSEYNWNPKHEDTKKKH